MGHQRILGTKWLGDTPSEANHFFLVSFTDLACWVEALAAAPWFMYHRYIFTMAWNPAFDMNQDLQSKALVWIELPYRVLILKCSRRSIVAVVGPILHFSQGKDYNSYPHGRAGILWDMTHKAPQWIKLWLDPSHIIWQEFIFKDLPPTCRVCQSAKHLTYNCPCNCHQNKHLGKEPHHLPPLPSDLLFHGLRCSSINNTWNHHNGKHSNSIWWPLSPFAKHYTYIFSGPKFPGSTIPDWSNRLLSPSTLPLTLDPMIPFPILTPITTLPPNHIDFPAATLSTSIPHLYSPRWLLSSPSPPTRPLRPCRHLHGLPSSPLRLWPIAHLVVWIFLRWYSSPI